LDTKLDIDASKAKFVAKERLEALEYAGVMLKNEGSLRLHETRLRRQGLLEGATRTDITQSWDDFLAFLALGMAVGVHPEAENRI
jgi:hypothetical protein